MEKRFLTIIIVVALILVFATGCSASTPEELQTAQPDQASATQSTTEDANDANMEGLPKVGVTVYRYDNNFMSFVRVAMEEAAVGRSRSYDG